MMQEEYEDTVILLTKKNVVPGTKNNILRYEFNTDITFKDCKISLNNISLYYSWFNIVQGVNDTFYYKFLDSNGALSDTVHTMVITPGSYDVNDLNEYCISVFQLRGQYWIGTDKKMYVPFEFISNPVYYKINLLVNVVPVLGTGYTLPAGATWAFPTSQGVCPQIILSSTNTFNTYIGLDPGTYPSETSNVSKSYKSTQTPDVNPYSTLLLRCNVCNAGELGNISDLFYLIDAGEFSPRDRIVCRPYESFVKIANGVYNNLTFTIRDIDNREINIVDSDINISVKIRKPINKK
jgi:hypothetical protein